MKATFYVWRRNDGHVNASNGTMPNGWSTPQGDVTFELLLKTEDWYEALARIAEERGK